jgi:thioredoxin reductase (NADPH)
LKIYHTLFRPLEWNFFESHDGDYGFVKLITLRNDKEKIVGFHYLGPHAGEVT